MKYQAIVYHRPQNTAREELSFLGPFYFLPWTLAAALVTLPAFSTLTTDLMTPTSGILAW